MTVTGQGALHAFLAGRGRGSGGRTVADVLAFTPLEIERVHDFVQWLFPNRTPSRFNPEAPVLTDAERDAIRADPVAMANFRAGVSMMRDFYEAHPGWRGSADHNHLRITRILLALRELGAPGEAEAFHREILHLAGPAVSARSRRFWAEAIGRPCDDPPVVG